MLKKISLVLLTFTLILSVSCQKKQESIEEAYLQDIESEYSKMTNNATNTTIIETDSILVTPQYGMSNSASPSKTMPAKTMTPALTYTPPQKSVPKKATVNNFYSPWTSKNDPMIIKEIRVMIANKEYKKAQKYIDSLDFSKLPKDVDVGQLYQFKGIVNYFLAKNDKTAIKTADESFKKVESSTQIEKFKPLSLLWNGMLYQTYSMDENELKEAVALFDRIIEEYPRTRFANDAVFYKALTLKKMGRPEIEYSDLILSIKRGGFADTLIYSQVVNDYVPAEQIIDIIMIP